MLRPRTGPHTDQSSTRVSNPAQAFYPKVAPTCLSIIQHWLPPPSSWPRALRTSCSNPTAHAPWCLSFLPIWLCPDFPLFPPALALLHSFDIFFSKSTFQNFPVYSLLLPLLSTFLTSTILQFAPKFRIQDNNFSNSGKLDHNNVVCQSLEPRTWSLAKPGCKPGKTNKATVARTEKNVSVAEVKPRNQLWQLLMEQC